MWLAWRKGEGGRSGVRVPAWELCREEECVGGLGFCFCFFNFIFYVFIFGCVGSSLLRAGFL